LIKKNIHTHQAVTDGHTDIQIRQNKEARFAVCGCKRAKNSELCTQKTRMIIDFLSYADSSKRIKKSN
jgi:hypothetical protein